MGWLPKKVVVVPVDFSTASADALRTAMELVAQPKDLHVLYVTLPSATMMFPEGWAAENASSRTQAAAQQLSKFLADHQASDVTQIIREGDPGLMIADYADEAHADLIAMPSHGYHGVARVLLGSVTERVLRHAKCPILVLRRQA
ncbi:MAG: universal stress protein [Planctomycetes bacterium]|nr:universal stress protein [Planctomycetota bacterium]